MDQFNEIYSQFLTNPNAIPQNIQTIYGIANEILKKPSQKNKNSHDEVLTKMIYLFPHDVNMYYKMGNLFKLNNNIQCAMTWHKMGYQIDPTNKENTIELCKILFEHGLNKQLLELNKNNLFDRFLENQMFLGIYARSNFTQLYYKNGIQYLNKLIDLNKNIPCKTQVDRIEKWKNYHDAGYVYCMLGEIDKSIQHTEKAVDLSNKFKLDMQSRLLSYSNSLCYADFTYTDHEKMYHNYLKMNEYFPNQTLFDFSKRNKTNKNNNNTNKTNNDNNNNNKKIRIGYLSSDYVYHAVTNFILPILKNHDKNRFEIVLFSNIEEIVDLYINLSLPIHRINKLSDKDAATLIYNQNIDILIDLNGHTANNRLGLLSMNPAPIQITYMGYPNTTGLKSIKYRITDSIADHPETKQKYSEELIRFPRCFLLYENMTENIYKTKQMPNPQDTVMNKTVDPNNIILGAINKENKNSPFVLKAWSQILQECPNTKLLIKLETFDNNDEREAFYKKHLNVPANRLIIVNKLGNEDYERVFSRIDILLDTYPYSGTTTTCNALFNSIPVVSLYNKDYHVHNVSSSILTNAGLSELVASSPDNYVEIVKNMVNEPLRIENYKKTIKTQFMKSMNPKPFMRDYEKILIDINENTFIQKPEQKSEQKTNQNKSSINTIEITLCKTI